MSDEKKVPKPVVRKQAIQDGWENLNTGLGILGRDNRLGSAFNRTIITQEDAEEVWRGDDIAARIVETIPNEMLREGHGVQIEADKSGEEDVSTGRELSEEMEHEARRIDVTETLRKGLQYARAYGGAGILLGVDDGTPNLELPLREDRIASFDWMTVLTPRELQPVRYYSDMRKPRYGEVSVYRLVPIDAVPGTDVGKMPLVHESRIIRLAGAQTSRGATLRNHLPGWDDSVFCRTLQVINDFQAAWQGTAILLNDFAPPVLKLKGLAKLLGSQSKNDTTIAQRAQALNMSRSIARTVILDTEEEWKRETVTVNGLADILDKLMLRLAAAAAMPVSLLMGQAPAGLNATGDSDIRWFYDGIAALQERVLRPALTRVYRLMFKSQSGPAGGTEPENWDLVFHPLWQLTVREQADVRYIQAQADSLMIVNQVCTPEEIAKSRFGGNAYSTETEIDWTLREKMMSGDQQEERLAQPPEIPPTPGAPKATTSPGSPKKPPAAVK